MYYGIDASFKALGLSYIDCDNKEIVLGQLTDNDYSAHSTTSKFKSIYKVSNKVFNLIIQSRKKSESTTLAIGHEVSTAYGQFNQGELFALDYAIYSIINLHLSPMLDDFSLYSQSYLQFINNKPSRGKDKYKKEDTIFLIEDILIPIFKGHGYKVTIEETTQTSTGERDPKYKNRYIKRETITDGEADSFIYAVREFVKLNKGSSLAKDIIAHVPRFEEDNKELS